MKQIFNLQDCKNEVKCCKRSNNTARQYRIRVVNKPLFCKK
jgi:hypothetical protein